MCKPREMSKYELERLKAEVDTALAVFLPVRLGLRYTRCGKANCFCDAGPADGSWGNLHGPYVYARFRDRKSGSAKQVSLGVYYDEDRVDQVLAKSIAETEFFRLAELEYDAMPASSRAKYEFSIYLSDCQFEDKYGLSVQDDEMGRSRNYYATRSQRSSYRSSCRYLEREQEAVGFEMCKQFGVGSIAGQEKLAEILKAKYFIVS